MLALCADLRIASLDGRYGLTEVKVGVPYPQGAIRIVRAELPAPTVRNLALSNRLIESSEAVRLGLFDEALAPDAVLPRAMELASELAAFPTDVFAATKRELRGPTVGAVKAAIEVGATARRLAQRQSTSSLR